MLDSVLPLTENSFTGAKVLISGVEIGVLEVPLHEVNIKSNLINPRVVDPRVELARFLGLTAYYRNLCLIFSEIAAPLTNFLSKNVKFVWTDNCKLAFDKVIAVIAVMLKQVLC